MKKRTRWLLIAGVVLVGIILTALSMRDEGLIVEVAQVRQGPMEVSITEEGKTRVRERYAVFAPTTGRISRITFDAGDNVEAGAILGRLYPLPGSQRDIEMATARVSAAEALRREVDVRLDDARNQLAQLERDVARANVLASDSILSAQELEQSKLTLESARKQVVSIEAALEAADAEVAAARAGLLGTDPSQGSGTGIAIRAPSSGTILRVYDKSERVVQAGVPLIEIGDSRGLEVVVDVLSEDAVRIRPGDQVTFINWGGTVDLNGRVRIVEPDAFTEISALGVTEQRVNVIADIFDAPEMLGSGFRVEARIVVWSEDDVLTIPSSGIFQDEGMWNVFAVVDGRAQLQQVDIGQRSAELVQILGGIAEGDVIILFPSDQIEDGIRVRSEG
ncbi:MAG: HlyD family efflux transporter periplasmic adaptor subunit [Rhodothermales bacterium]|nr:HlyD family efflux transporter periplasmic adaptor subunit [Rhodothermales bacterium]